MLRTTAETKPATTGIDSPYDIELSVVIPCLNEAETLGTCLAKAREAIREHDISAEIIVADNGSTDDSQRIAIEHGCRVIRVAERGYGAALIGGIEAARGKYVIMGDADDSYDFREIPRFMEKLREGHDLVQGCRLPWGGGCVSPGAMPLLHRWIGNPLFTILVRRLFRAPINDVYCGLRGFTKKLYDDLDLRCTGMEFATEMVIKASLFNRDIAETPITLHPDGRRNQTPHLRTFRDGWRTLRFFLVYSPNVLFMIPGLLLTLLGLVGYALAMPGLTIFGATLDAHTLLFASLAILVGLQASQFAVFAKEFGISEGLLPRDDSGRSVTHLQRAFGVGLFAMISGASLLGLAVVIWGRAGFGSLDYGTTMRIVIPGVTLAAVGFQAMMASFMGSLLSLGRR